MLRSTHQLIKAYSQPIKQVHVLVEELWCHVSTVTGNDELGGKGETRELGPTKAVASLILEVQACASVLRIIAIFITTSLY